MKKALVLMISLMLAVFLPSCKKEGFVDSASCEQIGKAIETTVNDEQEYLCHDETHLALYFDKDEYDDSYSAYSASTTDISEFGVFHAPNERTADELYDEVCDYVSDMKEEERAFIASCAPNELTKLDAARVKRFGNYVVYTVLDKDTANEVLKKVEELVLQEQ